MNRAHSMHPFALAAKNAVKSVFYPAFLNSCEQPARWRRCWQWAFDMGYQDATREKHGHEPRWGNRVATLVAKRAVASLSEAQASRPAPSASG